MRGEIIHSHDCRRARHKRCANQASGGLHHHYDLLGAPYSPALVCPRQPTCSVASLFMVLVRILTSSSSTVNIRPHILRVMTLCGTCCCFPARSIISPLIELFKTGNNGKIRSLGFGLLERTIYLELGAISNQDTTVTCVFCRKMFALKSVFFPGTESLSEDGIFEIPASRKSEQLSVISSSPGVDIEKVDNDVELSGRSVWECLELYRELVESTDNKLSHSVTSHLLKVAPRCTSSVKHRLMFRVFYPVFISSKINFLDCVASNKDASSAKFNLLSCLSAFSSILSGSVTFAKEFVSQYNGLNHIIDLISLPSFSKICCSILEVTAIVEIWKLEYENESSNSEVGHLPSLSVLEQSVKSTTSKILSILNPKTIEVEETPVISNDESSYVDTVESQEVDNSLQNAEDEVNESEDEEDILLEKLTSEDNEPSINIYEIAEEGNEDYLQLLTTVCVFWKTCSNLVLYSPQYRHHLTCNTLSKDALTLLRVLLDRVTSSKHISGNFKYILINILKY